VLLARRRMMPGMRAVVRVGVRKGTTTRSFLGLGELIVLYVDLLVVMVVLRQHLTSVTEIL